MGVLLPKTGLKIGFLLAFPRGWRWLSYCNPPFHTGISRLPEVESTCWAQCRQRDKIGTNRTAVQLVLDTSGSVPARCCQLANTSKFFSVSCVWMKPASQTWRIFEASCLSCSRMSCCHSGHYLTCSTWSGYEKNDQTELSKRTQIIPLI